MFRLIAISLLLVLTSPAQAFLIDFNEFTFPNSATTWLDIPDVLDYPNAGGSGVDVTIVGSVNLRVFDLDHFNGGNAGGHGPTIIDNQPGTANPLGTDIYFSPPVQFVSLKMGDMGGDDDSPLQIYAYTAQGALVASDAKPWPGGTFPPLETLEVSGAGIARVHWTSGGASGSVVVDDLMFEPDGAVATTSVTWAGVKALFR